MTALSIPERARELLTCLNVRSDCWWNDEKLMTEFLAAAMRSERELCAKELEALASEYELADAQYEAKICTAMSKLLRDGGHK